MTSTTPTGTRVPHRGATAFWTLVVPALVTAATAVWAFSVRDRLPDPVAIHWGPTGPDGAGSFAELVVVPLAIIVPVMALGMWALGTFAGQAALTRRLAGAVSVWTAALVSGITLTTATVQLDVADWTLAGALEAGSVASLVVASGLAALAGWLTPGDAPRPTSAPLPAGAARLDLGEHENATWVRTTHQAGLWPLAILLGTVVVVTGLATRNLIFPAVLGAILTLPLVGMTMWTVTVDRRGLTVASRLGWPRQSVPLEEIEAASTREVSPLKEFGGWGIRTALDGATGVVLRTGEGIDVQRTGGRRFVVTVDDAATGAALLNTLASRTR